MCAWHLFSTIRYDVPLWHLTRHIQLPERVCALEPCSCNPVYRPSSIFTYHFSTKIPIVVCGLWHLACGNSPGLYFGCARFESRLRHRLIRYCLWLFTGFPGHISKCVKLGHALLFPYTFNSFLSGNSTLRSLMLNYRYTDAIQASTILPSSECVITFMTRLGKVNQNACQHQSGSIAVDSVCTVAISSNCKCNPQRALNKAIALSGCTSLVHSLRREWIAAAW
jgi:hypothetical protein